MFDKYLSKNLKAGEVVLREVRRSPWSFLGAGIVAVAFLLAPFFFLFPLLRWGALGVLSVLLLLLIGLLLVARVLLLYHLNVLFVTNLRLVDIDRRGFFDQAVSEVTYDKIQDVSFSIKGVAGTLLHFGTVEVQTAGQQTNIEIRKTRNPERVHELIVRMQEESAQGRGQGELSADELVSLVRRLKEGLGEDRFKALLASAKRRDHHDEGHSL